MKEVCFKSTLRFYQTCTISITSLYCLVFCLDFDLKNMAILIQRLYTDFEPPMYAVTGKQVCVVVVLVFSFGGPGLRLGSSQMIYRLDKILSCTDQYYHLFYLIIVNKLIMILLYFQASSDYEVIL